MTQRSDPAPKCSRCDVAIRDSDLVLRDHGQLYHAECARIPTSDERVREYREIAKNGRHEPPAVRCGICQTGIGSVAELVMTPSGPTHARCQPIRAEPRP